MNKMFKRLCCVILLIVFLMSISHVNAVTLEDEGTEGNAAEYTSDNNAQCIDFETGVTAKRGTYYLKFTCPESDVQGQAYDSVSGFEWGDLVSVKVWVYRPAGHFDGSDDKIGILFKESDDVFADSMIAYLDVGKKDADSWYMYTLKPNDFEKVDEGLHDYDYVEAFGWINHIHSDPGDQIYLDGLEIYYEAYDGPHTYEDKGTEGDARYYDTYNGATVADEIGVDTSPKVGSYALIYSCRSNEGQMYRELSSSINWNEFSTLTVWTYRPSDFFDDTGDRITLIFRASAEISGNGMMASINVGKDAADRWVQHTIQKSDFQDYNNGLTGISTTAYYMAWAHDRDTSDYHDILFLDGLNIEVGGSEGGNGNGSGGSTGDSGGSCLGTIVVSFITIVALVAVGVKIRRPKGL